MRLCFISPEPIYPLTGGGTPGSLEIVKKMVKNGYEVHILTPLYIKNKKFVERMLKAKIHPFNFFAPHRSQNPQIRRIKTLIWAFIVSFKLSRLVKKYNLELVFARNFAAGISALLNRIINKTPYVVSVTDITTGYFYFDYKLPKWIVNFLVKLETKLIGKADLIFTITEEMKKVFVQEGVHNEKIIPVYEGVNLKFFRPHIRTDLKKKLGLEGNKIIFFHGMLQPRSNLTTLIESMKHLPDNIKLLLVGSGPILNDLKKICQKENIKNVIFIGFVPYEKIPEYISIADICILPYLPDFATNILITIKIVEYAAMAKPIISSPLKGLKEVFRENRDLLFYNPTDEKDLVEKILLLLNDHKLAKKLGNNARKVVEKKLNWDCVTSTIITGLKNIKN